MNFKNNLKNLRIKKVLTQKTLAEKLTTSLETVRNWEQGKTQTDFETLEKITKALDCDYNDLLK